MSKYFALFPLFILLALPGRATDPTIPEAPADGATLLPAPAWKEYTYKGDLMAFSAPAEHKATTQDIDDTGGKTSVHIYTVKSGGGIRIGTPAVTTRGMKEETMMDIADLIHRALQSKDNATELEKIRDDVRALTRQYPLPQ